MENIQTNLSKTSSKEETCKIYVIDEFGEEKSLELKILEYRNLMDLVLNELWEEWGIVEEEPCAGLAISKS